MKSVQVGDNTIFPSKIICVGRNYVDHIKELGNEVAEDMVLFMKPNAAISQQLQSCHQEPLHYEAELCFMVQQGGFHYVAVGLDLTKRGLQSKLKAKGLPWERAKAFTGSALFSDFVPLANYQQPLALSLNINGECRQSGSVDMMLYSPTKILAEIQSFTELNDGDIVMTGTPAGVGEVVAGDIFQAHVLSADTVIVSQQWQAI
ncbi:2-keto-4-pentenoate hydratase/2-oxohepta-3-ene-1,7-dioic acid hydratase (catechol pathway) [Colwellia chukchiensis]|uniref:2-keto-4-pentenoate hydratase/2-oxohepta-3-ene-1,7-dioic acid hydratase (Catechol pathway) n=1 Tax=Colwellia chukchiensis TaxID=641665 RepID=A0A1H7HU52_9GAMM|nr:fumarylacetoacetate hydrolase family protein [Colwellia chukchiensis]SEK53821.1 2-keto-4-pentenoate hydratase/2-oxohepta-3-ene-1,7-dioic acid hydratase (catechol pathway) [Colwellia chukchiensis]